MEAELLCEEVRNRKWNLALAKVPNGQPAACGEIIDELRRRAPGFSLDEYPRAIAQAMKNTLF